MPRLSRKRVGVVTLLLLAAFGFRLFVALRLANDSPDDGRVYAQIARNILEQHVYSHEEQSPFVPSLIRLPGYPLFLSAVYAVAGHGNNTAVRVVQAFIDTGTCALIALVAFQWSDDEKRRRNAALIALLLAGICPFTTIYVGTILTEVPTSFLAVLLCLLSTLAFKAVDRRRSVVLWLLAGLTAGFAVLFRPDSGLFAAAVGFTILLSSLRAVPPQQIFIHRFWRAVFSAALFSFAFCLVLVPWTIRNRRVFGVFQPLSPAHGEMPGEFVPRGYLMWLRTWLDDGRYVGPVLWQLDLAPINIEAFPKKAFDSTEERDRVAALMEKYNHPVDQEAGAGAGEESGAVSSASPEASPSPEATSEASPEASAEADADEEKSKEDETGDEEEDESADEEEEDSADNGQSNVEMTPDIDAAFAQIALERISRAPLRYYVILPLKRACSLWFDTHSQYYPFDGELLPLKDLDYEIHQQYWLPLFAGLTWVYTILGVIGGWLLCRSRSAGARRWVLLAGLIIFLRLGFFSTLENPEPRYTVEIFPFLAILGGIAVSLLTPIQTRTEHNSLDAALD
jgi:4-amino-4-deoxy-L-arabinose transferase-like glycosyltransferase